MRYLSSLGPAQIAAVAAAAALVPTAGIVAYRVWRKSRISPEERERRRRAQLAAFGKMGDATLVDIYEGFIAYSYGVRGVEYTATQDVTALGAYVPSDFSTAGPLAVKYDPKNPANSIVVAEQWTGLRIGKP